MDRKSFWNQVAKYGVLLGVTMGASKIFEQAVIINSGFTYVGWIALEWLLFAVLFFVILHKATKERAAQMDPALGFSFGLGLNYMILISIFAAVPVACIYYVYINSILGYDNYVDGLISMITTAAESQPLDSQSVGAIEMLIEQMRTQVKPSIFSVLFSTIFQYILAGGIAGLALAGFTSRKAEIFEKKDEE